MKLNIIIGGAAGQGINKVSEIVSNVLVSYGYFTFNYRDYQSLVRGGHNFNVLTVSNEPIESNGTAIDILVALDERTLNQHKSSLKKGGILIKSEKFKDEGRNLNVALAGCLVKILGIPFKELESEISNQFKDPKDALSAAKKGFDSQKEIQTLKKINNKISILSGSQAIAKGAVNSGLDLYIAYPMTPATGVLHEIATDQLKHNMMIFQAENEIASASMSIGASFTGAKTMTGTSGGGFDLMSETLSLQGISEVPLTVYLASRPGPGTSVPTYTAQGDLNIALNAGHGEFPRFVLAPGNPVEAIEKTSEALFLAEKFKTLSILLGDKHLGESEFSSTIAPKKTPKFKVARKVPGKNIIKNSSYEDDKLGNSTEEPDLIMKNVEARLKKEQDAKKFIEKNMEMIKIHGKKKSKNLIIGWGSTAGAIKDSIKDLDVKFLQILYCKPLSSQVEKEIKKAKNVVLIENNATGQMGQLIKKETGIEIKKKILRYDGRPFISDELNKKIKKLI